MDTNTTYNNPLVAIQQEITEWADSIIPDRTVLTAIHKLVLEEVPELLVELRQTGKISPGEIADVLILAIDIATLSGIDATTAIRDKMIINRQRKWVESFGTIQHVEEE
jgi:NTP pyrophosphatase (non-canonical NTP hydrolase)